MDGELKKDRELTGHIRIGFLEHIDQIDQSHKPDDTGSRPISNGFFSRSQVRLHTRSPAKRSLLRKFSAGCLVSIAIQRAKAERGPQNP